MRPRHLGRGVLAILLGVTTVAIGGSPAAAATPVSVIDASTFTLKTDPALWRDYAANIAAVEAGGAVTLNTTVQVATSKQHVGVPRLCHDTGLYSTYGPDGFCWDATDDKSSNYNTTTGGWVPQGLTASHDGDNTTGTINGHHIYAASWYYGINQSKDEFTRISLVANTGSSTSYGHVLLVEPTAGGGFRAVKGNHADGISWYGNKLFVADSGWLEVYDLRHIWRMNSLTETVGRTGGTSSARWHQWALPMIGKYWTGTTGVYGCSTVTGAQPCLSSLSLDRTGADALISVEFLAGRAGGRIIRWPLNATTALPRADDGSTYGTTTAAAAYSSPIWDMQGAAADANYLYISGRCPTWVNPDNPTSADAWSCIHRAKIGSAPSVLTPAPPLLQNLSYAPLSGRLWGLNERINTSVGKRVVFSIKVPA